MHPYLNLGFIQIHYYSICIFIAMLIGVFLVFREAKRQNIEENIIVDLLFYAIIIGIIGARLYFVLFHISYYLNDPLSIFKIWEGGLAIHGGIIAALIFIYFYTKKKELNLLKILDVLVVALLIAQAIGRWGNFFNSEAHGPETTLETLNNLFVPEFVINGMQINGIYYLPTFYFESILCLLGFIIILIIRKKCKIGDLTAFYLVWYGLVRFYIESFRTDSLMFFDFKIAQIVSIIMVIIGVVLFIKSRKNPKFREE